MKRTTWGNGYSGISVVLIVVAEEAVFVAEAVLAVEEVVLVEIAFAIVVNWHTIRIASRNRSIRVGIWHYGIRELHIQVDHLLGSGCVN